MPGTLVITTLSDGTNSTSSTNLVRGSCQAWVNFNGTGTPAIRGSYNVSSITDRGTGQFTVNLTNALSSTNMVAFQGDGSNNESFQSKVLIASTSTVTLDVFDGGFYDPAFCYIAVFG